MVLRRILFCVLSSTRVIRRFFIADIRPSQIFVILFAFRGTDPSATVFFKIIAMVEWDMGDW
jgi:hypothetical protein